MDRELELVRAARPDAGGPNPELALRVKGELMAEIAEARAVRRTASRRRRRLAVGALAPVAALASAVVAALTLVGDGDDDAWAAAVQVARTSPRLLVGLPDWKVTRADEFSVASGEMTFARGDRQLELRWEPGRDLAFAVEKRARELDSLGTVPVAGDEARLFRYPDTNDFTAVWLRDGQAVEAQGLAPDVGAFKATIATLHRVDVDTWLAAMPDNVVKPASRADVVDEMLAGVPVPDDFRKAALEADDAIRDRYQLAAQVTGAIACAWIDRWIAARRTGDDRGVREAVSAMQSSHGWPILLEMKEEGDYPEVLWELADAMAANAPVSGGKPLSIGESYQAALGCTSG